VAALIPLIKDLLLITTNQAKFLSDAQGGVPGPDMTGPRVKIPPPPIAPVVPIYGINEIFGPQDEEMQWDGDDEIELPEVGLEFITEEPFQNDEVVPLVRTVSL
jgi:hypothetical protein